MKIMLNYIYNFIKAIKDKFMHSIDLAYMAGVFDADGSVSLIKRLGKNGKNDEYYLLAQIAKVSPTIPTLFYESFGGSYSFRNPYVGKDGIKRLGSYYWKSPKGEKCKNILLSLLPFLKQKKDQAKLLIEYINENPFIRGKLLTQEDSKKRENKFLRLRSLKVVDTTGKRTSNKKRINSTDENVLSYIAGLMDTDGSFSIKRESPKRKCKSPSHSPMILLSMVDMPSLNLIHENCIEGSIFIIKAKNARHNFSYRFGIYSAFEVITFIEKLLPYLKIKKQSAECLLEFCKNKDTSKSYSNGLPESELQFREESYMRLKELNDGVYKSSLIILKTLPGNAEGNKGQAGDEPCSSNAVSEKNPKIVTTKESQGYAVL